MIKETFISGRIKYWWTSVVVGLLVLVLAVWTIITPDKTLTGINDLFISVLFVGGACELILSISGRQAFKRWGWLMVAAVLEILLALFLLTLPVWEMTVMFIYIIGFWIMSRSVWMVGESLDMKRLGLDRWRGLLLLAVLSVIASLIFFLTPLIYGVFVISFLTFSLVIYGFYRIILGFRFKHL